MIRVADQLLVLGINDEIEQFEGYVADQYGAIVGDLGNPHLAISSLDRQFHLLKNPKGDGTRGGLSLNRLDPLESQLVD